MRGVSLLLLYLTNCAGGETSRREELAVCRRERRHAYPYTVPAEMEKGAQVTITLLRLFARVACVGERLN